MPKRKAADSQAAQVGSFEDSLIELQAIVSELEDGSLELEASLARFERGIGLLRNCHQRLEAVEQRIELLTTAESNVAGQAKSGADPENNPSNSVVPVEGVRQPALRPTNSPPAASGDDNEDDLLF